MLRQWIDNQCAQIRVERLLAKEIEKSPLPTRINRSLFSECFVLK